MSILNQFELKGKTALVTGCDTGLGQAMAIIATNNTQALREDADRSQAILSRIPAGRWGLPEDFKGPVVFLCSEAAAYMNGHVMVVDGGWMAR